MTVSGRHITRAGATAAMAGGLLRIAASFAPATIASEAGRELLYVAVDICLVSGLIVLYFDRRKNVGWPGACAFIAALSGFAVIRANRILSPVDLYPIGSVAILCGLILLTVVSWRARRGPAWLPIAFTTALVFGALGSAVPRASILVAVSGVVFAVAFAGIGWTIWSDVRRGDDIDRRRQLNCLV